MRKVGKEEEIKEGREEKKNVGRERKRRRGLESGPGKERKKRDGKSGTEEGDFGGKRRMRKNLVAEFEFFFFQIIFLIKFKIIVFIKFTCLIYSRNF